MSFWVKIKTLQCSTRLQSLPDPPYLSRLISCSFLLSILLVFGFLWNIPPAHFRLRLHLALPLPKCFSLCVHTARPSPLSGLDSGRPFWASLTEPETPHPPHCSLFPCQSPHALRFHWICHILYLSAIAVLCSFTRMKIPQEQDFVFYVQCCFPSA